jgi:AraC-like DNA-binding protein
MQTTAGYGAEPDIYSTRSLTHGHPTWVSLVNSFIGRMRIEALGKEDGFFGRLTSWQLGCLKLVLVSARGVPVRALANRERSPVPRSPNVWLGMCLRGSYEIAWGHRTVEVGPLYAAVLDYARPRTITFASSCDLLWVKVPHIFLPARLLEEHHVIIDGTQGAGYLARQTLQGIIDQGPQADLGDTDAIAAGVMQLVSAAVTPLLRDPPASSTYQAGVLQRVKQHVEQNLGNDALCLQSVAEAVRLSPRYINKLFEAEETSLMRWIWSRRLQRARAALESGGQRTISELAYACGFKNLSHFSRSFRERYRCAPSELLIRGALAPGDSRDER